MLLPLDLPVLPFSPERKQSTLNKGAASPLGNTEVNSQNGVVEPETTSIQVWFPGLSD